MPALIRTLSHWVTEVAKLFLGAWIAAIVLITLAAVWWRYVLNSPIAWIEQVSNILFIWVTFVGAAVLYRQKLHIGVDMFIEMLKGRARTVIFWVIELLNLSFIVVLFIYGLKLSIDVLPNTYGALDISPAVFYFAAPVSCGMMMLYFVEKIVDPSKRRPEGSVGDF
ncbi:TRAP transporter small permease [Phreatobacter oligotrophus]|uniref:TRAP transporter small permease n=1 Tax=Phreatobacter oligotrophus TaxID=1122261 RepID=UPI002352397F|nr:TRAP transporter small permease [Phreatobacter oligotrophus]MBX9991158.1 TRAP transporter small permease [Phreatobacter oligotrophus]